MAALKRIEIVVTAHRVGTTNVVPFSSRNGLQFYDSATKRPVVYEVPSYSVLVINGSQYTAVRFGLQNDGTLPPPATRTCDAGLSNPHTCTPSWIPTYSPHSFIGGIRIGAWRLLKGQSFLIHEGADSHGPRVGGSLGCIEILDGDWNGFLEELEKLAGGTCDEIAKAEALTVRIQHAPYPTATLQ